MDKKTQLSLFQKMYLIRSMEEKIVELYPEQEMRCPVHLCIGQEAVAAGVCENLTKEDYVFSNHRSHAHYLAKGGDPKGLLAELYGKVTGCSRGRGGSMHLIDLSVNFIGATPILGGTIPMAVGAALSSKMQGKGNISVVFFGDAAVEEGIFHESLNYASLRKLPVLFICENNLYSVQTPLSKRQPNRKISSVAIGHSIKSYREDGNNVVKVYDLAKKSINKIRKAHEPIFLEFLTYRWREHCGPFYDYDLGYRSKEEIEKWEKQCPLKKYKRNLISKNIVTSKEIEQISHNISIEIEEAVDFAKKSPFPPRNELEKFVYSE